MRQIGDGAEDKELEPRFTSKQWNKRGEGQCNG